MKLFKYFLLLFMFSSSVIWAQESTSPISEMTSKQIQQLTYDELLALPFEDLVSVAQRLGVSIDELLKMKTNIASTTSLTPRETPGIVSIITNEEIKNLGARDLIDVLRTVPGISFGYDNYGVVGLQMRGNWAHEGKVLLVVDGQEFNDLNFGTNQFGSHFDVNQIQKIEIIRGPGSAKYGGNAELGVINIVTFTGEELKKVSVAGSYGAMENSLGHKDLSIAAGNKFKDWDLSLKAFVSQGNLSDNQQYVLYGDTFDLSQTGAETNAVNLNFGAKYKGLSIKAIYDDYSTSYPYYDDVLVAKTAGKQEFTSLSGEVKYDWKLTDKLTITPKVNVRNSIPYYETGWYANTSITRSVGNVTALYNATKAFSLSGGVEYFNDYARMMDTTEFSVFNNGKRTIAYNTISLFAEGLVKTDIVNFVIGGRFENHNQFGSAFAPRIGLTKAWDDYHLKLLYSGAFRSPSIGNIRLNPEIKPEQTQVLELEAGVKLNQNMFLTANVFNIKINNPIVFWEDELGDNAGYENENRTGTWGYELEYRIKYNWGYAAMNYSFSNENKNDVSYYQYPGEDRMIGAMAHKISINGGFYLNSHICLNPSFVYLGDAFVDPNTSVNGGSSMVEGKLLTNCYLNFTNYKIANKVPVEFGVGVFDLFSQKYPFVQPYNGGVLPYPGRSREITARLAFSY